MKFSSEEDKLKLKHLFSSNLQDNDFKINTVKNIFNTSGASEATRQEIKNYTDKAFLVLETLNISDDKKTLLKNFGQSLMNRNV